MLPVATVAAPQITLRASDVSEGTVAHRQAVAAEAHGSVLRGNVPTGPFAGPCIYLVGPEAAEAVLGSQRAVFSSAQGWVRVLGNRFGRAVLNTDDPLHLDQRRLWAPAFGKVMLDIHARGIARYVDDFVDSWKDDEAIDVYAAMRALAFRAVAGTVGGMSNDILADACGALCTVLDGDGDGETESVYLERKNAARKTLANALDAAIAQRRRTRPTTPGSLLDLLLEHFELAADANAEIRSHLTILLIAGYDTGATLYSRALYILAEQPPLADRLARELHAAGWAASSPLSVEALDRLPCLDGFMQEVGRLYPPLLNVPRVTISEATIGGFRIPPGTLVALALAATQQLERVYPDPLRFNMARYANPVHPEYTRPFQMLTFGGGGRMCLGIRFAQMEFKVIVATVAARLRLHLQAAAPVPHSGFWAARPVVPMSVRAVGR